MKDFNNYVSIYKEQLRKGEIQKAYAGLVQYVMKLKTVYSKKFAQKYRFGNILRGYMDYTYFYFLNDYLKSKKLKFGLVLNHKEMRFEIWLLGQTIDIQKKYRHLLKATAWNKDKVEMPQYSILEVVLVENPNFNNLDSLSQKIEKATIKVSDEIIDYLKIDALVH